MDAPINLLIVDDEIPVVKALERQLRGKYTVYKAYSAEEGLELLQAEPIQVVLSDERMPGMSGVEFLEQCQRRRPEVLRVIISGFADTAVLKKAINHSHVHGFVNKPINIEELVSIIDRHRGALDAFCGIVGRSKKIHEMITLILKVARTDSTILVTGESGTGKELVSRAIHACGRRKDRPFVIENCAAITQSILEAELFGHVKGSFTGATLDKPGLFEIADKGILVLDEIGDLNKDMQTKLLRVIEGGTFRKVGGTKSINVDVQMIFATNRNLKAEVEKGNFREDLYYRINVINIHIAPLRDRLVDIPLLANHFARFFGRKLEKDIVLEPEVIQAFMDYHWPGNVRELEHEIERAVAITDTDTIGARHLTIKRSGRIEPTVVESEGDDPLRGGDFYGLVSDYEQRLIRFALQQSGGSKRKAATILKMTRQSLCNKISKYEMDGGNWGD